MKKSSVVLLVFVLFFSTLNLQTVFSFNDDQCRIKIEEVMKWNNVEVVAILNVIEMYFKNPDLGSDIPMVCVYIINRKDILGFSYLDKDKVYLFEFKKETKSFEKNKMTAGEERGFRADFTRVLKITNL